MYSSSGAHSGHCGPGTQALGDRRPALSSAWLLAPREGAAGALPVHEGPAARQDLPPEGSGPPGSPAAASWCGPDRPNSAVPLPLVRRPGEKDCGRGGGTKWAWSGDAAARTGSPTWVLPPHSSRSVQARWQEAKWLSQEPPSRANAPQTWQCAPTPSPQPALGVPRACEGPSAGTRATRGQNMLRQCPGAG